MIRYRKIGGLHFLSLGRFTFMACRSKRALTRPAPVGGSKSYPCPAAWHKLREHWDAEAVRLHDNLRR